MRFKESGRAELEKAMADLRAKLTDEHYRTAMLVLKRRHGLDELIEDKGENLPFDLGELAVRFRGTDTTPPPKRGRGALTVMTQSDAVSSRRISQLET